MGEDWAAAANDLAAADDLVADDRTTAIELVELLGVSRTDGERMLVRFMVHPDAEARWQQLKADPRLLQQVRDIISESDALLAQLDAVRDIIRKTRQEVIKEESMLPASVGERFERFTCCQVWQLYAAPVMAGSGHANYSRVHCRICGRCLGEIRCDIGVPRLISAHGAGPNNLDQVLEAPGVPGSGVDPVDDADDDPDDPDDDDEHEEVDDDELEEA